MTWKSLRNTGETLRAAIAAADARRDGILPMDLDRVRESFGDELTLLGALQLRWHTRLAGRIERELMNQPMALEDAVLTAWRATAAELPGVRAIIDHYRAEPLDEAMARAMEVAAAKEHILLAVMSGRVSAFDDQAARIGAAIEQEARAGLEPDTAPDPSTGDLSLLGRLRAVLTAA